MMNEWREKELAHLGANRDYVGRIDTMLLAHFERAIERRMCAVAARILLHADARVEQRPTIHDLSRARRVIRSGGKDVQVADRSFEDRRVGGEAISRQPRGSDAGPRR